MAGSNAVASGAAILTANADGLVAGLKKSEQGIQDWGTRVTAHMNKAGAAGGGGFAEKAKRFWNGTPEHDAKSGKLLGNVGGMKKLAVGAGAAALAVGLLGHEAQETLDDIAKMGTTAQAMGLTAEQFTGMAGVAKSAGEDTREFIESLVTMGKLGTDAAAGTKEASAAMQGMGIDANKFIKLRADEQFFQIFDSLGKVQDPLQRTRFLMQAFGEDGGKYLLPLLAKAPEDIRKMADQFAISGEKMKKAQAASAAWKGLGASLDKLKQNTALAFAPMLEGVANVASRILAFFQPAFDWLGRAWGSVQKVGGAVWDFIIEKAGEVGAWLEKVGKELFGWTDELPTVQDAVVTVFRYMGRAAATMWDVMKAGAGLFAVGIGKVIGFVGDLADRFKATFKSIADMGADAADALGLDETAGKFRAVGAAAEKIAGAVKGVGEGMENWGKDAMGGIGKSAAEFDKWLDNALKPKAAEAIKKGMVEGAKDGAEAVKLSGAFLKGSKETYGLVLKNQLRGMGSQDEPIKQVARGVKKGNELQQKGNAIGAQIFESIENLKVF